MPLDATALAYFTNLGIDFEAAAAAHAKPEVVPFPITLKTGEIKIGTETIHVYDTAAHNGLIGRVKNETLAQAEELGIKAVAKKAGVDYTGNDATKLIEAVETKLKLPVNDKLAEKDRDILTLRTNWETEKKRAESVEARLKDREESDRDISFFPDNRIKAVKDKTLRAEMKEDGITFGEYEDNGVKTIAVFENGVVKKNADLTIVKPKDFAPEYFKSKGWIAPDATQPTPEKKSTFDGPSGGSKTTLTHESIHAQALAASGGVMNEKYQAVYTDLQLGK